MRYEIEISAHFQKGPGHHGNILILDVFPAHLILAAVEVEVKILHEELFDLIQKRQIDSDRISAEDLLNGSLGRGIGLW